MENNKISNIFKLQWPQPISDPNLVFPGLRETEETTSDHKMGKEGAFIVSPDGIGREPFHLSKS
jgi:hypothetical protein